MTSAVAGRGRRHRGRCGCGWLRSRNLSGHEVERILGAHGSGVRWSVWALRGQWARDSCHGRPNCDRRHRSGGARPSCLACSVRRLADPRRAAASRRPWTRSPRLSALRTVARGTSWSKIRPRCDRIRCQRPQQPQPRASSYRAAATRSRDTMASTICTAFSAAPLRRLSPTMNMTKPRPPGTD